MADKLVNGRCWPWAHKWAAWVNLIAEPRVSSFDRTYGQRVWCQQHTCERCGLVKERDV